MGYADGMVDAEELDSIMAGDDWTWAVDCDSDAEDSKTASGDTNEEELTIGDFVDEVEE